MYFESMINVRDGIIQALAKKNLPLPKQVHDSHLMKDVLYISYKKKAEFYTVTPKSARKDFGSYFFPSSLLGEKCGSVPQVKYIPISV